MRHVLSIARPLAILGLAGLSTAAAPPKDAILLSDVNTLTFYADRMTSHRRLAPVPQMSCTANPPAICDLFRLDTLRCRNVGAAYDAEDIQWSCTAAALPLELKLGSTDVSCEGYASAQDPRILRGSCAVTYRLLLTDLGEQRYPELASAGGGWGWGSHSSGSGSGSTWESVLSLGIFLLVLGVIVYSCVAPCFGLGQYGAARRADGRYGGGGWWPGGGGGGGGWWPGFGGGGGGGGGGRWDSPPPPYPGTGPKYAQDASWRPGFWTGLAGGAAAAYMAGQRGNNRDAYRNYDDDYYRPSRRGNSGWGGSSAAGPSTLRPTSSARHQSTGFGSTSRR